MKRGRKEKEGGKAGRKERSAVEGERRRGRGSRV